MARPVIAISGSADARREYRKPLRNLDVAAEACRELGTALAVAGWDLVVFSEDQGFVESWVVQGYRSSPASTKGTIHVRQPLDEPAAWRSEPNGPRVEHEPVPAAVGWEFPFYGAILEADALLLIGGDRGARTAGIIALNRQIPLLPVPLFGGAAEQIWDELTKIHNDTDRELRSAMTGEWTPTTATRMVATLDEQRRRQVQRLRAQSRASSNEQRQLTRRHMAGLVLMTAAVAGGSLYYGGQLAGVIALAMIAAASGALISRQSADRSSRTRRRERAELPAVVTGARGAFAGFITVLTYVVSQTLGSGPNDGLANGSITIFTIALGAVSGFTADRVLARIRPIDVGSLDRYAAPSSMSTPSDVEGGQTR